MLQKRPWTYKITKVNDTFTKGIISFVVKQDKYEPEHDYSQTDPSKPDYGDMYADYYVSDVNVCHNDNFDCKKLNYEKYTLNIETINDNIKLNSAKVLTAKIYDGNNVEITKECLDFDCEWSFELWKKDENKKYTVIDETPVQNGLIQIDEEYSKEKFKCKFKFIGDEQYIVDYVINVTCKIGDETNNMSSNILLDIVSL